MDRWDGVLCERWDAAEGAGTTRSKSSSFRTRALGAWASGCDEARFVARYSPEHETKVGRSIVALR